MSCQAEVVRSAAPARAQFKRQAGRRTMLVFKEGRQYLHAITINSQVRLVQLPLQDRRYLQPVQYKGKPYPVRRAVRLFLAAGKTLGITDGAKAALQQLRDQAKEEA